MAAYKITISEKTNLQCQDEVSKIWKTFKNDTENLKAVDLKLSEWKSIEKRKKNSLTYFWGKASQKPIKEKTSIPATGATVPPVELDK